LNDLLDPEIVQGLFQVIMGVVEKDTRDLLGGVIRLKALFNLPPKIDVLLSLATALLARAPMDEVMLLIEQLCEQFSVDPSFIKGIVAISKHDYSVIVEFANRFGQVDPDKVQKFVDLLGQLTLMQPKGSENSGGKKLLGSATGPGGVDLSNMSYPDLFKLFDKDKNGNLDFDEFSDMLKYLNLPLSQNKALRIFSEVQKGDGTVGENEFTTALSMLEEKVANRVLGMMGFSTYTIAGGLLALIFMLALIFSFIFLGIGAFSTGSTFEAVVNSVIAIAAGGSAGKDGGPSKDERKFKLKGSMDKVMGMLKNTF
jgi:hypothetical protein